MESHAPSASPTCSAVSHALSSLVKMVTAPLSQQIGTCRTFISSDCFSSRLASSPLSRLPNFDSSSHRESQRAHHHHPARPVPCSNARHQGVARCPRHTRSHSRPLCYACNPPPVLRPPPSARLKFSPQQIHAQRSACPALPGRHRVRVT